MDSPLIFIRRNFHVSEVAQKDFDLLANTLIDSALWNVYNSEFLSDGRAYALKVSKLKNIDPLFPLANFDLYHRYMKSAIIVLADLQEAEVGDFVQITDPNYPLRYLMYLPELTTQYIPYNPLYIRGRKLEAVHFQDLCFGSFTAWKRVE